MKQKIYSFMKQKIYSFKVVSWTAFQKGSFERYYLLFMYAYWSTR